MATQEPNPQQAAAVEALRGPVLIQAGAGTGKTRTLTERFVRALDDVPDEAWKGVGVESILTITFTDKAAGELSERIRTTLRSRGRAAEALAVDRAWISTIHGLCSRILRRYALEAGLDPEFVIMDSIEDWRLKERVFERAAASAQATPEGARLFEAYDFANLFKLADRITGALRARGLTTRDVLISDAVEPKTLYRQVREFYSRAAADIEDCGAGGKNTAALHERCACAASRLALLNTEEMPPYELSRAVLGELAGWKAGGRASGAAEPIRLELKELHATLLARAAACVTRPYEETIVQLIEAFSAAYARGKREVSGLDFDDLQAEATRLLIECPGIANELKKSLKLVMVDEFQDTDALQLALIGAISGPDLCTVGDEYQSIYRFRGADIDVYRSHNATALRAGARTFELSKNYRSHAAVLDFVNRVFASEHYAGSELIRLEAARAPENGMALPASEPRVDLVVVHKPRNASAEARQAEAGLVARRMARLRDDHGIDPGGMVVLMRQLTHADVYARALRAEGFDVAQGGGGGLLGRPEVLHFRALLDVISNPLDETALAAVLACGIGRVSDDGLWSLRQDATANKDSIWHALKREAEGALSARDRETVGRIVRAVDAARARVGREPLQDILLRAVEDAEFDLELLADPEEGMPALANVARVAEMAREFEESGGTGPAGFALYLADRERFNEHTAPATIAREGSRMVRITSVHSSKGLEYPVVAVVEAGAPRHVSQDIARWSCREGALTLAAKNPFTAGSAAQSPDFSRLDTAEKQAEDDESKRLFYVACTRARDVLIVSGTTDLDKADEGLALTQIDRVSAALRGSVVLPSRGTGPVSVFLGEHQVRLEAAEPLARTEASEAGEAPSSTQKDRVSSSGQESVSTDHEEGGLCRDSGQVGAAGRPSLPERLSYTDLALFDACELRFYLERVLRIGRISSAPAGAASFGSAVHTALQLSAAGHPPAAERLTALARRFQLNDALHGEMTAAVATFVRSELAHALEGHATVRREWAFALRLGPQDSPVDLVGTMDAYGRSGITGLVVDYKSGASGDASELEERYRLQARCYALVALADGCDVVDVVFCRPQVRDAGDRMQEVRFRFSRQDAGEIEQEILERRRRMGSSTRQPRETWSAHACVACSASGTLCSRVEPGSRSDA